MVFMPNITTNDAVTYTNRHLNLLQYVVQPAMNCYQIMQPIQILRQCGTRIEAKLLSPQTANLLTPHIHAYLSFLAVISRHTW